MRIKTKGKFKLRIPGNEELNIREMEWMQKANGEYFEKLKIREEQSRKLMERQRVRQAITSKKISALMV